MSVPTFSPWYPRLFFGLLFLVGLLIVDDYGISWDEAIQRRHGRVSIDYAAEKLGLPPPGLEPNWHLEDYQWANYGMLYQLTANLLELQLGWEDDPYQYYRLRHYLNFFLFWLACFFFYRTLRLRFPTRDWYPLVGTLLLVLSPRIFAHAFFNPKDHILLVFYLINVYTLLRFLDRRNWSNLFWHALATGLALNTRLPALIVPLTTVLILGWEMLRERPFSRRNLVWIGAYLPLSVIFLLPFFPYLWEDTFRRLWAAFSEMSDFAWEDYVLLFGQQIFAPDVPAYYIPAWIMITTPLIYLLFLFAGGYAALRSTVGALREGRFWRDGPGLLDFAQLGLAVGPILVVILLGSTLYNGWRHMHFVYPSLVFLLMVGVEYARQNWARPQVQSWVLGVGMALTAVQMVYDHPHQHVYFNAAIRGEPLNVRFDMDYWGVGFRDAFLQLARQVPEGEVRRIKCDTWPCTDNLLALPPEVRKKLVLEEKWHLSDYVATHFNWPESRFQVRDRVDHFAYPAVELRPGGNLTIGIYNIKVGLEEVE